MKMLLVLLFILAQISYAQEKPGPESKSLTASHNSSIFQLKSVWKNQRGESLNIAQLEGKARVLIMMFTRCETACPLIVEDLRKISAEVHKTTPKGIDVSIFSFDAKRETPESLLAFANKRKLPLQWELFTSTPEAVAELAAALGVRYKRLQNGDFIHSNIIFLLNKTGEVIAQKRRAQ